MSGLAPLQKVEYIKTLCSRLGLDPATQPFQIQKFQGKEVPYLGRGGAAQMNKVHKLSSQIVAQEKMDDLYIVHSRCIGDDGRSTDEIGAVAIGGLKGEALANAIMKARTKAMRRATITHCGLGYLDETEVESLPGATTVQLPAVSTKQVEAEILYDWTEDQEAEAKQVLMDLGELALNHGMDEEIALQFVGVHKAGWMSGEYHDWRKKVARAAELIAKPVDMAKLPEVNNGLWLELRTIWKAEPEMTDATASARAKKFLAEWTDGHTKGSPEYHMAIYFNLIRLLSVA